MNFDERMELASKLLRLSIDEVRNYSGTIPGSNDTYLTIPSRGGISLIIGEDGSVLRATSAISFDQHYEAFKTGERTPLSYFA